MQVLQNRSATARCSKSAASSNPTMLKKFNFKTSHPTGFHFGLGLQHVGKLHIANLSKFHTAIGLKQPRALAACSAMLSLAESWQVACGNCSKRLAGPASRLHWPKSPAAPTGHCKKGCKSAFQLDNTAPHLKPPNHTQTPKPDQTQLWSLGVLCGVVFVCGWSWWLAARLL